MWLALVASIAAAMAFATAHAVKHFTYEVLETRPHRTNYFTQGLCFRLPDNSLIESTGLVGQSQILRYSSDMEGGKLALQRKVPDNAAFGEGVAQLAKRLYQLTWKNNKVYVWDSETLELVEEMESPSEMREGWGLATSAAHDALIASEGSAKLFWLMEEKEEVNKTRLVVTKQVVVKDCELNKPVIGINELETVPLRLTHPELATRQVPRGKEEDLTDFAQNLIHARDGDGDADGDQEVDTSPAMLWGNIFGTMCIAVMDPVLGEVRAYIHLDGLGGRNPEADVLNGIAFRDDGSDTVWLTGKKWDKLYRVALRALPEAPQGFPRKCAATFSTRPKQSYMAGELQCKLGSNGGGGGGRDGL